LVSGRARDPAKGALVAYPAATGTTGATVASLFKRAQPSRDVQFHGAIDQPKVGQRKAGARPTVWAVSITQRPAHSIAWRKERRSGLRLGQVASCGDDSVQDG
jgi:hypothetical protein